MYFAAEKRRPSTMVNPIKIVVVCLILLVVATCVLTLRYLYFIVGNNNFRDVVSKAMPVYGSYDLSDKSQLVDAIITEIKDAGGRFLKKHSATGKWYELEDGQVREKVRYAVRDRNNKLKNRESKPRKKKQKTRRPKQPPIASLSLVSASMVCPKSSLVSGGESSHSGYVDSNPTLGTQRGTSDIYCTSLPITVRPADVLCGKQKESINHGKVVFSHL